MPDHDPASFLTGLSAKLATRSRHVCAFLGAGTSRACGLPDVSQLQEAVLKNLGDADQASFSRQLKGRNLEGALSRLRRIAALLVDQQTIDDLTAEQARKLDAIVCKQIVSELDATKADPDPVKMFAAWIARCKYHLPVELFTVNYDLLLETALEELKVPYFDGFIGVLQARFQTELVEAVQGTDRECVPAFFTRLWKLHGSVNWTWGNEQQIVRIGGPVEREESMAAIYPSDAKYEESHRVPFAVLQDRLRRSIREAETLMMITGYSFGDEHLNEILFDAAKRSERSEFIAFCHSGIPETLAKHAALAPNLQVVGGKEAILSGIHAPWVVKKPLPHGLWVEDSFGLTDFKCLAQFLARKRPNRLRRQQPPESTV